MLIGQALPGAMILAIGILILSGEISILWLVGVTLMMGLGWAFMGPARQAWVGELMPDRLLPNAVALLQVALTILPSAGAAVRRAAGRLRGSVWAAPTSSWRRSS